MQLLCVLLWLQQSHPTDEHKELTPQDKLERVWTSLRMPDNKKLDMAIKYSSDEYHSKLEGVTHLELALPYCT